MPLTSRDEEFLFSLLESGPSLAHLIRQAKMTLDQALAWWRQPQIKAALAELADLSQARAKAIASNDAMQAVSALQSSLVLCESEFYEQADPKTRLKAFDSARKAAVQVLKLAGISGNSCAITRGSARVMSPAITRGPERVMSHAISGGPERVMSRAITRGPERVMSCAITRGPARVMPRPASADPGIGSSSRPVSPEPSRSKASRAKTATPLDHTRPASTPSSGTVESNGALRGAEKPQDGHANPQTPPPRAFPGHHPGR